MLKLFRCAQTKIPSHSREEKLFGAAAEKRVRRRAQSPLTSVTFVAGTATHTLVCTATGSATQPNHRVHSMVKSTGRGQELENLKLFGSFLIKSQL